MRQEPRLYWGDGVWNFFLLQPPPFPGSTAPVHAPQFLLQQLCSSCLCQTPLLPGPAAGIGILLHREYWAAPMCPHPHNLKIPTAISLLSVCSVGDHLPAKYYAWIESLNSCNNLFLHKHLFCIFCVLGTVWRTQQWPKQANPIPDGAHAL